MCEQVWDKPRVQDADKRFDKVLERVRDAKIRVELREVFETAVQDAAA